MPIDNAENKQHFMTFVEPEGEAKNFYPATKADRVIGLEGFIQDKTGLDNLATKAFVTEAIHTAAANLVSKDASNANFASLEELQGVAANGFFVAGEAYTVKKNDVAYVVTGGRTMMYRNAGATTPSWQFWKEVANRAFTDGEIGTIQCGATAEMVTKWNGYEETINGKADASAVATLSSTLGEKAAQTDLSALSDTVTGLSATVAGKADASALESKADAADVTTLAGRVTEVEKGTCYLQNGQGGALSAAKLVLQFV